MLKQPVNVALAMMAGAVFLYCSQQMSNGPAGAQSGGGGGTCCTPPAAPAPTTLFDDSVQMSCRSSNIDTAPIDVSGLRTVVVHVANCRSLSVKYANGVAGFVRGAIQGCDQGSGDTVFTIDPKLGKQVMFTVSGKDCNMPIPMTVVGHPS